MPAPEPSGTVLAVASDSGNNFTKPVRPSITLLAGLGVQGDAHMGVTVQHLYDKKKNPDAPNLRQVHLMHAELFDDLAAKDISVAAGQMGENITTRGIDILGLPRGTRLHLGPDAIIEVTGLRSPCSKLNKIDERLLEAVLDRTRRAGRRPFPLSGIMSIVIKGGVVTPGDDIRAVLPKEPFEPLLPV